MTTYLIIWSVVRILCMTLRFIIAFRRIRRDVNRVLKLKEARELAMIKDRAMKLYYSEVAKDGKSYTLTGHEGN